MLASTSSKGDAHLIDFNTGKIVDADKTSNEGDFANKFYSSFVVDFFSRRCSLGAFSLRIQKIEALLRKSEITSKELKGISFSIQKLTRIFCVLFVGNFVTNCITQSSEKNKIDYKLASNCKNLALRNLKQKFQFSDSNLSNMSTLPLKFYIELMN